MATGLIGMLDLSIVTDRLIKLIDYGVHHTPLWPTGSAPFTLTHTGSSPDSVRLEGGCQLSLYLFHVARDPYQLNVPLGAPYQLDRPPTPTSAIPRPPTSAYRIPHLPQSLDLYYLLTAYADKSYVQEQQAMSVAMTALYEHPIVTTTVVLDAGSVTEEFTLTMGIESADEISRLWQAMSVPLRLSAVYKVSVVFLAPPASEDAAAPPVERVVAVAGAADLPLDTLGDVSGTSLGASYVLPGGATRAYDLAPAVAAPGDTLVLHGAGLDTTTATRVFLLPAGGAPIEITGWRTDVPRSASSARIALPAATGPAPAGTPPAGVYELSVGSDAALGDDATHRSRQTPFSIGARVDPGAGPPLLPPVAGVYHLTGAGFVTGRTELLLGTVRLTEAAAPPTPGTFSIGAGGAKIDFQAPTSLPAGRYAVRLRVSGVESRPARWVDR